MNNNKKAPLLGLGLAVGAVLAGIAAFFYNPISGEKHREEIEKKIKELEKMFEDREIDKKVKEIFGEITTDAKQKYLKTKKAFIKKLAVLKVKLNKIDKEKYMKIVDEIVDEFKTEFKHAGKITDKLKDQLIADWKKIV